MLPPLDVLEYVPSDTASWLGADGDMSPESCLGANGVLGAAGSNDSAARKGSMAEERKQQALLELFANALLTIII